MEKISLPVLQRPETDRARLVRKAKMIPAVVYGHGFETLHLKIDYQTFRRVFEKATFSTIVTLDIEEGKQVPVLVHDVQYHPVSDEFVHVDFLAIRMDEKVTTHIALEFTGESEAVKLGAVLSTNKNELEVSCLPGDLVHNIEVDLTPLKEIGDTIRVSDITAPKGIEILDPMEEPIVSAIELRVVEEEEPEVDEELAEGEEGEEGEAKEEGEEGDETSEASEGKEEEKK